MHKVGSSQRLHWKLVRSQKYQKIPNDYFQEHTEAAVSVCIFIWLQPPSENHELPSSPASQTLREFLLLPNSKIRLLRERDSGKCSPLYLYISGIGSL